MKLKFNQKLNLMNLSQVISLIFFVVFFVVLSKAMFEVQENTSMSFDEIASIGQMTEYIEDFMDDKIGIQEIKDEYKNIVSFGIDNNELMDVISYVDKAAQLKTNNLKIEKDIFDLIQQSIEPSNQYIFNISKKLADENLRDDVSTLERTIIGSATQNIITNYEIKTLFLGLKEDIDTQDKIHSTLKDAIENAVMAKKSLAGTPFVTLPEAALKSLTSMQTLSNTYISNTESIINTGNLIRDNLNKLEQDISESGSTKLLETSTAIKEKLVLFIILIAIITCIIGAFNFVLTKKISQQIGGEPEEIAEIAENIASGNLNVNFKDSNKKLGAYKSMYNMSEKLKEIVHNIINGADNIAAASQQMSSTSQQISQGANEQASSVEEVSSSMEEMTANIQQNTDNAQKADKSTQDTETGIVDSVGAAEEAIQHTNMISDKINIISEISFQTNILALNAAVEAARAGEHGKGFAVVAAEVRKLAEKSANSAQDIENIVGNLKDTSDQAGVKLNSVIPKIKNNVQLIQEIAAASFEQNSGATQVNSAIQQLNHVTQQNAAASEEMATSSEELASQADQLRQTIAFFKINTKAKKKTRLQIAKPTKKETLKTFESHKKQETSEKQNKGFDLVLTDKGKLDDEFQSF